MRERSAPSVSAWHATRIRRPGAAVLVTAARRQAHRATGDSALSGVVAAEPSGRNCALKADAGAL